MAYELHIVEDTFDDFRRRIARSHAEVNLDAAPLSTLPVVGGTVVAPLTMPATTPSPTDAPLPDAKAAEKAAKAAEKAAKDAAKAAEKAAKDAAAATDPVVTPEQVRAVMGALIKVHPLQAGAVTAFLAEHAAGAKNISSADPQYLPALLKAGQDWLAGHASDPTG